MKKIPAFHSYIYKYQKKRKLNKKILYPSVITFIALLLFWILVVDQYTYYLLDERREQINGELIGKGHMLTREIADRNGLIHGLDAFVQEQVKEEMSFAGFSSFASGIYLANEGVSAINIAPRGVVAYAYPEDQASRIIGYSLINDPREGPRIDIQRSMMTREPIVSGPLDFITGGHGLVLRKAVYFNDDFWGIVSITVDLNAILKDAGVSAQMNGIDYAIKKNDEVFFGQKEVFAGQPVTYKMDIPYNNFVIGAIPTGGWDEAISSGLLVFRLTSGMGFVLAFFIAHMLIYRNAKIRSLVQKKTIALNKSNYLLERELQKVAQLELRLKKAQSMAHIGNWQMDLHNGDFWASDEVTRIFGFEMNPHLVHFESLQALIHKEDRPHRDKAWNEFVAHGGEYNAVYRINRYEDGEERVIRATAEAATDSEGVPMMIMGVNQDITEQSEAERALAESERTLSALLANLPGMAYRRKLDTDWTMEFVSQGCFELTGYLPEELIQSKKVSFGSIIKPEHRQFLWETWKVVLSEKMSFREEYAIITANGEERWVWEQGQGIFNEENKVIAVEGFITDVTERKKKEEEIVYLSYHDIVTGLHNRRYFEEMKKSIDRSDQLPLSVIMADINGLKLVNDTIGHAQGDRLLFETAGLLKSMCREQDILARTGGDEFCILLPQTDAEEVGVIIENISQVFEEHRLKADFESLFTGIALGFGTKTIMEESLESIIGVAEDFMYRRKLLQSKSLHSSLVNSMKATLAVKSHETEEHAARLARISKSLGQKLGLGEEELTELELLSTLHDIGKIVINDNILNKPGRLNEEEFNEMKKHAEIGYRIAKSSPELKHISHYILTHHERWDGKGYPQGLKGDEIPLLSRILSIVDAFDAMTNDRSYRKAMLEVQALKEIEDHAGTQFDPDIAVVFVEMMKSMLL